MRVRIISKSGRCAIDDRSSLRDATPSMEFDTQDKPHVILTGPASTVELTADGRRISMGANSVLVLHQRAAQGKFQEELRDMKLTVGRIWAWIDSKVHRGERFDDNLDDAPVGIRG